MRIGIYTQPLYGNFGGLLQNYALQEVLTRMGYEPMTIDLRYGSDRKKYYREVFKHYRRLVKGKSYPLPGPRISPRSTPFAEKFVRRYINVSKPVIEYTKDDINRFGLDLLLVGSDQVWRPKYNNGIVDKLFLSFADGVDIPKVAYAASFGTSDKEFSNQLVDEVQPYAEQFDHISVREESGVKLVKEYFGLKASHVLDPTLLLTGHDYMDLVRDGVADMDKDSLGIVTFRKDEYKKGLFHYILDVSNEVTELIGKVNQKLGCNRVVGAVDRDRNLSICGWLKEICTSTYVLTDSFHGMVFSILFHRKFAVLCNHDRGAERFRSLLEIIGLEVRLVDEKSTADEIISILEKPIDWATVDNRLDAEREKSLKYLRESLLLADSSS